MNELLANICTLLFNIIGYRFWELDGLGIAFLLSCAAYLLQVFIICNRKYAFRFSGEFIRIFMLQLLCAIVCFCVVKFVASPHQYVVGSLLILFSVFYSLKELNKKLELKSLLSSLRNNGK
jgi:O-antigen/teichoic acid export membrane protein